MCRSPFGAILVCLKRCHASFGFEAGLWALRLDFEDLADFVFVCVHCSASCMPCMWMCALTGWARELWGLHPAPGSSLSSSRLQQCAALRRNQDSRSITQKSCCHGTCPCLRKLLKGKGAEANCSEGEALTAGGAVVASMRNLSPNGAPMLWTCTHTEQRRVLACAPALSYLFSPHQ